MNKSGPEHVLYVVQAGPNSYTQRSYGPTLSGGSKPLGNSVSENICARQFGEQGAMATPDPLYPYAQAKQVQHQSTLGAQRGYALCDRGSRPKIERSPKSCGRSVVKKRMPKTLRALILISRPAKCGKMARAA